MPYSIPSSPKILTLVTASILFILVGTLSVWEFAMVPGVYILLCSQEEKLLFFLHIQLHNHQKDLSLCLSLYYYGKVIVKLEKKYKQGI